MRRCVGESAQFSCSFPCERLRACSGVVSIVKLNDRTGSPLAVESVYLAAVVTGSSDNYGLSYRLAIVIVVVVEHRRFVQLVHLTRPVAFYRYNCSSWRIFPAINQSIDGAKSARVIY